MNSKKRNVGQWLLIAAALLVVAAFVAWQRSTSDVESARRVEAMRAAISGTVERDIDPDRALPIGLLIAAGFAGLSGVIVLASQTGDD